MDAVRKPSIYLALYLALLACAQIACADGIYKWVDAQGQAHFSDTPPMSQPGVQRLDVQAAPSSDAGSEIKALDAARSSDEQTDEQKQKADAVAQAKKDAAALAAQQNDYADRCKKLLANKAQLADHGRVRVMDEKTGQYRILTPEEKAAAEVDNEKQIKAFCTP